MTAPTSRTITDPTLGTITVEADAATLRLVITWMGFSFGFQYEDIGTLAARYTELTDDEVLTLVQTAADEINGTHGRVLH